jgi:inner membrane protein
MKNLKTSVLFKISIICVLILLLLLPASLIQSLIHERESTRSAAAQEIGGKWGLAQTITGPFISIPYNEFASNSQNQQSHRRDKVRKWMHFMPNNLSIDGQVNPELKSRGIFEVAVYESALSLNGNFSPIDVSLFDIPKEDILFDKAILSLGITDLKGIENQIEIKWDTSNLFFNSGMLTQDLTYSGLHVPLNLAYNDSVSHTFHLDLALNGSEEIYFTPIGKTTDVNLSSPWPDPSFWGTFLPDEREVNEDGFIAHWNVLHLNRNFPQAWTGSGYNVQDSAFGAKLIQGADTYKKSNRVAKYAILFIGLTFLVFFFVEVMQKVFIHPIQYLLVGLALVVFYSLLLALSEHIVFNTAYLISTLLTLGLVTVYTAAVIKSKPVTLLISGILVLLYFFIFTIIQLQDYALLMGTIGIFLILAFVMYFSRKIDWYSIRLGEKSIPPSPFSTSSSKGLKSE